VVLPPRCRQGIARPHPQRQTAWRPCLTYRSWREVVKWRLSGIVIRIDVDITRQRRGKHYRMNRQQFEKRWKRFLLRDPCRGYITRTSGTSEWVSEWVSDENGSLKSETVKYGRESHVTRTREWLRWRWPVAIVNDRPVLSSKRRPHLKTRKKSLETKIWLWVSTGPGTKNDCAGEGQQRFTGLDWIRVSRQLVGGQSRRLKSLELYC
jgi:hypothetical protein